MALKPIEILKTVIEGDSHTITIDSVTSLGSGQYKLATENTLYLRTQKEVTIDSVDYIVVDFSINTYITVEAKDGSDTAVTADSFDINPPLFLWGNPKMVNAELEVRKRNKSTQIYPYVWLVDIHNTQGTTNPSAAVKRTPNFTLLFLDSVNYRDWTIDDHYSQDVYPLNNYLDYFFEILESRRDLFETDDISWTSVNVVNFGDYVVDKGMQERILSDNCTGISLQIDLPIIKNDCRAIDVNRSCPSASVSNSDDTYSATVASGSTLELPDITVTQTDGSTETVPAQTDVTCDSPEAASVTLQGNSLVDIPGGQIKSMTIRDQDDNLLTIATDTDTANTFEGTITLDTPKATGQTQKSGADNSYLSGDEANDPNGIGADFFTLDDNNVFNNLYRFTGTTGGGTDGTSYFDVNGSPTTKALAFPNDIMLVHSEDNQKADSILAIRFARISADSMTNFMAAQPFTYDGYSDWKLWTLKQLFTVAKTGTDPAGWFNYKPFDFPYTGASDRVWTRTPAEVSNYYYFWVGVFVSRTTLAQPYLGIVARRYTYAELGV